MDTNIAYCKIFPSIGLARLGNSPTEFYIGPQAPGQPLHPHGGFKDPQGRIKRQAARFRIYAYNSQNQVIKELTTADADINWTVHLANKKASFYEFKGRYRPVTPLRNATAQPDLPPDQRNLLIIDPGPRSISGANQQGANYQFDTGGIGPLPVSANTDADSGKTSTRVSVSARVNVPLGEIRTDEAGRLMVLASGGESGSLITNNPITDYANNDYWYDDTADGPVTAAVTLHNGQSVTVQGRAWVMCVPPHFTTETICLTTLYDQMEEVFGLDARPQLSFSRDLWPIFSRVAAYSWVNKMALIGHGPGKYANFLDPNMAAKLADNRPDNLGFRELIFQRIRNPNLIPNERIWDNNSGEQYSTAAANQSDGYYMPPMAGDYGWDGPVDRDATTWLAVTPAQYRWLERWRDGNFDNDWPALGQLGLPQPLHFEQIPLADQPQALTRAMLERTVGAPFYPGIEMTYIVRDKDLYSEPFRFADNLQAGDITRWMALPWQADFFECNTFWWPSARPDDVIPATTYLATAQQYQHRPGYLLTADKLSALSSCLPTEVTQKLTAVVDVPFSTQSDFSWTLTSLIGKNSYAQYGLSILQAAQQYDMALALGSLDQRRQWARGLGGPDDSPHGDNEMVVHWYQLGFITPIVAPNGQVVYVETERSETLPQTPPRTKLT